MKTLTTTKRVYTILATYDFIADSAITIDDDFWRQSVNAPADADVKKHDINGLSRKFNDYPDWADVVIHVVTKEKVISGGNE